MDNGANAGAFAQYLQSILKINELEKMTEDLNEELADSQRIMKDIKTIFNSIPDANNMQQEPVNSELRQENRSKLLEAKVPKLLMSDMADGSNELDLNDLITTMRNYAEELKKYSILTQPQPLKLQKITENLDLDQYASTLDQLGKRLANIKLNKNDTNTRNEELERKLTQLCHDVNMFTQIVQTKTAISQSHQNWPEQNQNDRALNYDNIINKLLSGINEVTYLLQNKI